MEAPMILGHASPAPVRFGTLSLRTALSSALRAAWRAVSWIVSLADRLDAAFDVDEDGRLVYVGLTRKRDEIGGGEPAREAREPSRVFVRQHAAQALDREAGVHLEDLAPEPARLGHPPRGAVDRREVRAAHVGARRAEDAPLEAPRRVRHEPGAPLRASDEVNEEIAPRVEAQRLLEGPDRLDVAAGEVEHLAVAHEGAEVARAAHNRPLRLALGDVVVAPPEGQHRDRLVGLGVLGVELTQAPRMDRDVADLIDKRKVPVLVVEEDVMERGIERAELIPGVRLVSRAALPGIFAEHAVVHLW
jgi:hypothetical protein